MIFDRLITKTLFVTPTKEATKEAIAVSLQRVINLLLRRLRDKFLVLNETSFLQSHCLWILEQRETLSVYVHNDNLPIEGTKVGRLTKSEVNR